MSQAGASPADDLAAGVSLDALFRGNAKERPAAVAIADPLDRASWTDGEPSRLTYAEADAAIGRIARRLHCFGLQSGAVVTVQLPNCVEAVLTLLAILRAGLVAVPVPMLWRRSELVAALAGIDAKALVTLTRIDGERPADVACEAAADLFSVSFPCAFGANVPDGVISLDLNAENGVAAELPPVSARAADATAIATFDAAPHGFFAIGRTQAQWLAAGLATLLEARIEHGDTIVTTLPPVSLAGIGGALIPWLLSGGTLQLVQGHSRPTIAMTGSDRPKHLIAPAAALPQIAQHQEQPFDSCVAVHRTPETLSLDFSPVRSALIVDVATFGEIGAVLLRRTEAARPRPIPLGQISAPSTLKSGPTVIETRIDPDGVLALRGAMVPRKPFPELVFARHFEAGADGFVRTGYRGRPRGTSALVIEAQPEGVATIGGLRFGLDDLATRVASSTSGAKVDTIEDPILGRRLRIEADDPGAAVSALEAAGHSRLVIEAVALAQWKSALRA